MGGTRILLDCTGLTASTNVTGIPRVFYQYLRHGYDYARRNGVTVLPVYVVGEGVFDARSNLPEWTFNAPVFDTIEPAGAVSIEALGAQRAESARARARHEALRRVLGPVVQELSLRLRFVGVGGVIDRMRGAYHRERLARSIARLTPIHVRPGDVIFMSAWWHDECPQSFWDARKRGALIVPLLHDVLPITLPDAYDATWRELFRQNVTEIATRCDHLMYVSAATRNELLQIIGSDHEPPHSIRYHGFDFRVEHVEGELNPALDQFIRRQDRFRVLMVGTIEPKKMHAVVLAACRTLWEKGVDFDLIVLGRPGWKSEDGLAAIRSAQADARHGSRVLWLSDASDAALRAAYEASSLILAPSRAEGFGLPLIEALSAGRPVLASDIPVFREIGGDHVVYFRCGDREDLAQALGRLVTDAGFFETARQRAAAFRWPGWDTVAEALFRDLCSLSASGGN